MKIKVKYANSGGITKLENSTEIQEVMINEDLLHPENESIAVGFKNRDSSGIIELTAREYEKLVRSIGRKRNLIRSVRSFGRVAV